MVYKRSNQIFILFKASNKCANRIDDAALLYISNTYRLTHPMTPGRPAFYQRSRTKRLRISTYAVPPSPWGCLRAQAPGEHLIPPGSATTQPVGTYLLSNCRRNRALD